jgi:oxygen-independent coproporphyrinogen III oxidase
MVHPGRGAYVHIPFCLRRCDYCDFTTFADRDEAIPSYVAALEAHAPAVETVFVGGGTPTYLPPADLGRVLAAIRDHLPLAGDVEWTVEANPETVTDEVAATLVAGGVTRVSLGAQSFDDRVLATLGRWYDPA